MGIWDTMYERTNVYFVRDAYNETDPTIHIWVGDYANLYGDSMCLELGSPLLIEDDPLRGVPIGDICDLCAKNLLGWIEEAWRHDTVRTEPDEEEQP